MLQIEQLSYWERKSFFENIDYLVIGAGIVGYATAIHLKEKNSNAKIVILEQGYLPSGASSKNAGFACFGSATELLDDIERFGEQITWETVEMRWKGLQYLRSIIGDENMKLQINGSWDLIRSNSEEDEGAFEKSRLMLPYFNEQIKTITGYDNVYSIDNDVANKFGFHGVETSVFNRLEGQIDTSLLNQAFYQRIVQLGIHTIFGVKAERLYDNDSIVQIQTNIGEIKAGKVAICTNGFAKQFLPNEDILPARAQVLITKPIPDLKLKGTFHYQKGYYYFRNIDNRILFGGGRNLDFEKETTTEFDNTPLIMESLHDLLKNVILPEISFEIDYQWAGIMGVGTVKKPVIKQLSSKVFCGVRLGGMGVAIGTLVGKEVAEMMQNKE